MTVRVSGELMERVFVQFVLTNDVRCRIVFLYLAFARFALLNDHSLEHRFQVGTAQCGDLKRANSIAAVGPVQVGVPNRFSPYLGGTRSISDACRGSDATPKVTPSMPAAMVLL